MTNSPVANVRHSLSVLFWRTFARFRFPGSQNYWELRYSRGDNSGPGSYDQFAEFKAEVLNRFIDEHGIQSVIEFGCGDGNQLSRANYPTYLGVDVSRAAVDLCRKRFATDSTRSFLHTSQYAGQKAELALSLDVIFHLVEDAIYFPYLDNIFGAAMKYVVLYCSDLDRETAARRNAEGPPHVRHRCITQDIAERYPAWTLAARIPNRYPYNWDTGEGSFADFFIYERTAHASSPASVLPMRSA